MAHPLLTIMGLTMPTTSITRFARVFLWTLPFWLALGGCRSIVRGEPDWLLAQGKALRAKKRYKSAQAHLRGVVHYHPESKEAEEGLYLLANTRHKLGKGQIAFEDFKKFVETYPQSPYLLPVAVGEYQLGIDHLEGRMPAFWFFGTDRGYGLRILRHMQRNFRNHSLAQKALVSIAEWHIDAEDHDDAIETLERLLEQYPRSQYALWARFELAKALFASNDGPLYDLRLLYRSRRAFKDFVGTAKLFGQLENEAKRAAETTKYIARIEKRIAERGYEIGRFYERRNDPKSAAYYYRQVMADYPNSRFANASAARLKELGSPS